MRSGRRVAVTGLGVVSAAGTDLDKYWSWVSASPPAPVSTPVDGFDPQRLLTAKEVRRSDASAQYAVAAAHLARDDARLPDPPPDPRRAGVVLSTVYPAVQPREDERDLLLSEGPSAVSAFLSALSSESAPASMVSSALGWRGPSSVLVAACAGGTHAVSSGADLVASNRCDFVVAGGTQGALTPVLMASYRNLGVLSDSGWVRPFDRRREGFVFACGAAVLLLEALDGARARGARIYAEVLGSAQNNDAGSMVSPSGPGVKECMFGALDDAELQPSDIGHVNAHGTATTRNDQHEAEALHATFGTPPPVTSIKRVVGHAAGASGSFEAVAAALSVQHGLVPSLGSDVEPDESLGLDLVVGKPRPIGPRPVLSNSLGLGGHNACLVLGPVR